MTGGSISLDEVLLIISCVVFLLLLIYKSVDIYRNIRDTAFSSSAKIIFYMIFVNYQFLLSVLLMLLLLFVAMWIVIMFIVFLLNVLRNKQPDVKGVSMFTVQLFLGYLRAFDYKCLPVHIFFLPLLLTVFSIFFVLFLYRPKKIKENEESQNDSTAAKKMEDTIKQYLFLVLISMAITAVIFIMLATISNIDFSRPPEEGNQAEGEGSSKPSLFSRLFKKKEPGAEAPGAEGAKPGAEGAKPGADGAKPGAEGAKPGADGKNEKGKKPGLLGKLLKKKDPKAGKADKAKPDKAAKAAKAPDAKDKPKLMSKMSNLFKKSKGAPAQSSAPEPAPAPAS